MERDFHCVVPGLERFDWNHGRVRFLLLVALTALACVARFGARRQPTASLGLAPWSKTIFAVAFIAVAVHRLWFGTAEALDVSHGARVEGDQGWRSRVLPGPSSTTHVDVDVGP